VSNAERRALRHGERLVVPRVSDVYAAMPAITGKLELEYEGEMKGADFVARELIRSAVAKTFDRHFDAGTMQQIVQFFDLGGEVRLDDGASAADVLNSLKNIQGLNEKLAAVGVKPKDAPESVVSAAEFVLGGLYAHKRIGRSEERVFTAGEKQPRRAEAGFGSRESREPEPPQFRRGRGGYN